MSCRRGASAIARQPQPLRAIKAPFNHDEVSGGCAGFGTLSSQSGVYARSLGSLLFGLAALLFFLPSFSRGGGPLNEGSMVEGSAAPLRTPPPASLVPLPTKSWRG